MTAPTLAPAVNQPTAARKLITADELLAMGDIGRCELIYGELIMMSPASFGHGEVAAELAYWITQFVKAKKLGSVTGAETGFVVHKQPDLVRAPDVGFVRSSRVSGAAKNKFFVGAPDLAVEVVSPSESTREILEKVNMWLVAGTASVWVADPAARTASIYRVASETVHLGIDDSIREESALPGFVLPVKQIFGIQE